MKRDSVELPSIARRRNGIVGHPGHVVRRSWQPVPEGGGPIVPGVPWNELKRLLHTVRSVLRVEVGGRCYHTRS